MSCFLAASGFDFQPKASSIRFINTNLRFANTLAHKTPLSPLLPHPIIRFLNTHSILQTHARFINTFIRFANTFIRITNTRDEREKMLVPSSQITHPIKSISR